MLPGATLRVGKLIIDEVVPLVQAPGTPDDLRQWIASGLLERIGRLLALEFGLAVLSDVLGRAVSLLDSLLSEQFSNETSLRLMEYAAMLDLEDFEDSELQDPLERARGQAAGHSSLIGQLFGQAQGVVAIASFAVGLILYAPWLIVLLAIALLPAFISEAHFNAQSYSLNYARTQERSACPIGSGRATPFPTRRRRRWIYCPSHTHRDGCGGAAAALLGPRRQRTSDIRRSSSFLTTA